MKQIKKFIPFILLAIVVLFSLGKTLQYYFYTDDYAFLYYIGNNFNFGWPYDMVLPIFRPVYKIFDTNVLPYFALAVFTYFFASLAVYFFINTLTRNRLIASLSSLIFATGYIGLDQFSMIAVSIVNNLNIINVCITLTLLIKWIETKKLRYYFLTFLMFWFSMWLFPYRAYPLILFLPTLEIIKSFQLGSLINAVKQFIFLVSRYIPFVLVASRHGIFSYGTQGTDNVELFYLLTTSNKIFSFLTYAYLKEVFAVFGRLIFVKPVSDILGFVPDQNTFALTGLIFFLVMLSTSLFFFFGKYSKYGRALLIILLLTIESYVGNMILNLDFDSNGPISRYLTITFIFFSAILPLFLLLILKKVKNYKWINKNWVIVILIIPIVWCFSSLSRTYEESIIKNRSIPSVNFFRELKTYIPELSDSKYSIFYFDNALYYPVASRFGAVLLSAAVDRSVNIAMPYKVSMDSVKIVDTFENFLRLVNNPPSGKKVSYYTFYVDENGLYNTTEKVFALLKNGSRTEVPKNKFTYSKDKGFSSVRITTHNVSSLTPIKATFSLAASPLDASSFDFPYIGIALQKTVEIVSAKNYYEKNNIQKDAIFKYLLSREKYYKTVKVDVESIHIGKQNPASYLVDDKLDTSWISDQSRWEVKIKPWIKLDLGEERNISRLLWEQMPTRVIAGFTISTSIDGKTFTKVNSLHQSKAPSDSNLIINDFNPIDARYILLSINKLTSGPGPGLSEIEVVESEFANIDLSAALRIKSTPFEYIRDKEELLQTYFYLQENAKLTIKALTNRDDPASSVVLEELPIVLDGQAHEYSFQIPPGGTELRNIHLSVNFPANLFVDNFVLENQLKEILDKQIDKKCQNFAGEKNYSNPFNCN
jgi:hypothetical protein